MTREAWWEKTPLSEMSSAQWEQLCDGCAICCLNKLEDEEDGTVYFTDIACELLDSATCRCRDYDHRHQRMADCVALAPERLAELYWLPPTCAYRLLAQGQPLPPWHPLRCGDPDRLHREGRSVAGRVVYPDQVDDEAWQNHIIDWPFD